MLTADELAIRKEDANAAGSIVSKVSCSICGGVGAAGVEVGVCGGGRGGEGRTDRPPSSPNSTVSTTLTFQNGPNTRIKGMYAKQLAGWLEAGYPRDALLVVLFERFYSSGITKSMNEITRFLGVPVSQDHDLPRPPVNLPPSISNHRSQTIAYSLPTVEQPPPTQTTHAPPRTMSTREHQATPSTSATTASSATGS